ncbi:MAG: lyase [Gammaproteobacteria bacterium]
MTRIILGTILTFGFLLPPVFAANPDISEWFVPWEDSRPRDPYVAPDGSIWFVGQRSDYVANLDPQSGNFRQISLEDGAGPHNLIVDDSGTIWYAGNRAAHIGKMDPETGNIHKIPMPDPRARDPHTLTFDERQENIWFTVQGGNFIGRLDMTTEAVDLIEVPTARARPYGIEVHDGIVWVVLFGTNKIARVDPATMTLDEIELPRRDARPRRIAITPDGTVWYGDYAKGRLGKMDPDTRTFQEWDMPSGERARPYAMAADDKGRVWFVETGVDPNLFWGFDSKTNEFFSTQAIESGGGTVRHMVFDEERNQIWFGADTNTIGVSVLPE